MFKIIAPAMIFADLARDCDVHYFTGLRNIDTFGLIFDYLSEKARVKGLSNISTGLTSCKISKIQIIDL